MHQEDDSFEDDYDYDYDDSQNNLDSQYKHYFKFDPDAWDAWGKMLYDALNDIVEVSPQTWYVYGFPAKSFPVNSSSPSTGKGKKPLQCLGVNYQNQPIWKSKYFINDPLSIKYLNHIKSHAVHFVLQPHYYKGMFDILN
jgi:hypothetical protein